MIFSWLDTRDAVESGIALADRFAPQTAAPGVSTNGAAPKDPADSLQDLFRKAASDIAPLHLNFFKKAKLANSFKWRLLENGVEAELANEVTQRLVMYLSGNPLSSGSPHDSDAKSTGRGRSTSPKNLLQMGDKSIAQGNYAEAIGLYRDLLVINPRHPAALNNLGAALAKQGNHREAEKCFHQAIKIDPNFSDAYSNVGSALMLKGQYEEAEGFLRRALKLNPRLMDARINLGLTLASLGRLQEAKNYIQKVLKSTPHNADAIYAMGQVAKLEGNFDDANTLLGRALELNPKLPSALADLADMPKRDASDDA